MKIYFKRIICVFVCIFIAFISTVFMSQKYAYAESTSEIEMELEESINSQLENLDLSEIENALSEINGDTLFKNQSFSSKIKDLINGKINTDTVSIFSYIANIFIEDILSFVPAICIIIAIAVLYSMVGSINTDSQTKTLDIIHFVSFGSIVIIVVNGIANIIHITSTCIMGIKTQMNAVFPVLLTLLTSLGGTTSVSVYQPAMSVLSNFVINIFTNILLPIFIFKVVFNIISNLTKEIKFNKFVDFFNSSFKWIIGIVLTIFSAFVSINGIMAGSVDGISIRMAKYTIKSGVPIIGSFLSDGMGIIMVSSSLIKNAVGVGGLILMITTILLPVIKIIVFSMLLKLASAILEPIADARTTNFISDISKSTSLATILILGVGFMYLIIVGLVMCSANIF